MKTILFIILISTTAFADYAQRRYKQAQYIAENVCTLHRYGGMTEWKNTWVTQCQSALGKCFPKIRPVLEVPQVTNKLVRKVLGPVSPWVKEGWCQKDYIVGRNDEGENINEGAEYDECVSTMSQKIDKLMVDSYKDIPRSAECDPSAVPVNSADSSGSSGTSR